MIRLLTILTLLTGGALAAAAQNERAAANERRFSIRAYRAHLEYLADDLLVGRAPGTRGGALASRYIATQFAAAGLEPIRKDAKTRAAGYFQPVPMIGNQVDHESVRAGITAGETATTLKALDEIIVVSEVDKPEIAVADDLLFVGYGIEAPEFDWDDYKGVDVRGKILVMLVNDPDFEKTGFGSESLTYYGRWTYKQEIARLKGARGLILIHTRPSATYGFNVVRTSWAGERVSLEGEIKNPLTMCGWISQPAFDRALAATGLDYAKLKATAESRAFKPMPLGAKLEVSFRQRYRKFTSPNVIGVLPGTAKKDEAVVFMGHWDHLGVGPALEGDTIYNGAVDNASGIAALICLAHAFATAERRPERTIVFLATTGEEKGLLGSEYYTVHPVVPLAKTVMVLNKDCCNFYGRRAGFGVFPVRYTDAAPAFREIGAGLGLELSVGRVDRGGGAFRMDSFPFSARGVVAFSTGLRGKYVSLSAEEVKALRAKAGRWYHQPNDEIRPFWRYDGIRQELGLLYGAGRHWADGAPAPQHGDKHPYGPAIRIRERKYTAE